LHAFHLDFERVGKNSQAADVHHMTTDTHKKPASGNVGVQEIFVLDQNGMLSVDREKLHASDGYKRQVKALRELSALRYRDELEKGHE
jgi:hypothetical protein